MEAVQLIFHSERKFIIKRDELFMRLRGKRNAASKLPCFTMQ